MTGARTMRAGGVVALIAMLTVVACSSSSSKSGAATTTAKSGSASAGDVARGIGIVFATDNKAPTFPPGFATCVTGHLDAKDKAALGHLTSSDDVPDALGVTVTRAGVTCNRSFLEQQLKATLFTGSDALTGIPAAAQTCAATKGLDAMVALDPAKLGSGTQGQELENALLDALQGCYPASQYLGAQIRQGTPDLTDAQVACIVGKLGPGVTYRTLSSGSSTSLETQAQTYTQQCAAGG